MLELLTQADLTLNNCGRPIPPAGYRWVDLPRVIAVQKVLPTATAQFVFRVQNIARTVFLCRSVAINTVSCAYQIRWPNGRVLEGAVARNPIGTGQMMKAELPEVPLDPDGQISIALNSTIGGGAQETVTILFYGVVRYLLKATGNEPPFTVMSLTQARRVRNGPNQNIMCPEWLLGEQCTPETPAGYYDEPFTLFADPVALAIGLASYDNAVQIPGDCEWFVIKRWSFDVVVDELVTAGQPVVGWRLPDGYSITGGDMVPALATADQPVAEGPVFVSLPVRGGTRMFLDFADIDTAGVGNITTTVRFDGVKRRKLAQ
jgi:hypothetical protein